MNPWHGLLVSVRDAAEAEAALAGGATVIDIKEPGRGSLGAAAPETIASIARAVAGRAPWTIAAGELADEQRDPGRLGRLVERVYALAHERPAAVKLGLAGVRETTWQKAFAAALAVVPATVGRVAVAYADWHRVGAPDPSAVVAVGAQLGCAALLIDTADKSAAGLLASSSESLTRWIEEARAAGMAVAVAGRITLAEIPAVKACRPDVVALRSAVCSNGRMGTVDVTLVRAAAAMLDLSETARRETA